MTMHTGDKPAPFTLPAKPGDPVDVGRHFGKEPVVLLFFPLAFSPVCTDEMCAMRDTWDGWSGLGAKVFGITADSPFVTDRFRTELKVPFPILSDFNRDVCRAWGVLHEDLKGLKDVPKRAAFVVGADGTIAYDWVSDDPGKMPDLDAVRAAVGSTVAG